MAIFTTFISGLPPKAPVFFLGVSDEVACRDKDSLFGRRHPSPFFFPTLIPFFVERAWFSTPVSSQTDQSSVRLCLHPHYFLFVLPPLTLRKNLRILLCLTKNVFPKTLSPLMERPCAGLGSTLFPLALQPEPFSFQPFPNFPMFLPQPSHLDFLRPRDYCHFPPYPKYGMWRKDNPILNSAFCCPLLFSSFGL